MSLSDYENAGVLLCGLICNSFSLLSVVLVAILFFSYPSLRLFAFKLVFFLCISSAGFSIGVLIGPSDDYVCPLQAVFVTYFSLSSVLWLLLITHSMKTHIINQKDPEGYLKKYLLVAYVFPIPLTLIPVFTDNYQRTSLGMCWANPHPSGGKVLIILQFWIFLLITMLYNAWTLIKLQKEAKRVRSQDQETNLNLLKYYNRLKHFSIIIYLSWGFALINTLAMLSSPNSPSFGLSILHVLFTGIQGVLILIAFIKDHAVYEALIDIFRVCLPCLIKKRAKAKRQLEIPVRA